MIIAVCGSIKFYEQMLKIQGDLEKLGHKVFVPEKEMGVNYWEVATNEKVKAKKKFLSAHLDIIEKSDAILVVNMTKKEIEDYIGANTFLEMGYAYYRKKKIFTLNPLPDQPYIIDELLTFSPVVLNGDLIQIK